MFILLAGCRPTNVATGIDASQSPLAGHKFGTCASKPTIVFPDHHLGTSTFLALAMIIGRAILGSDSAGLFLSPLASASASPPLTQSTSYCTVRNQALSSCSRVEATYTSQNSIDASGARAQVGPGLKLELEGCRTSTPPSRRPAARPPTRWGERTHAIVRPGELTQAAGPVSVLVLRAVARGLQTRLPASRLEPPAPSRC